MKCPKCGSTDTKKVSVLDERWKPGTERCKACGHQDDWGLFMTPPFVIGGPTEEEYEQYRSALKRRMLESFGPDGCVQTPAETREAVLSLIAKGEADVLLSIGDRDGFRHYAVRFKDPILSLEARLDSVKLYGLRGA